MPYPLRPDAVGVDNMIEVLRSYGGDPSVNAEALAMMLADSIGGNLYDPAARDFEGETLPRAEAFHPTRER